MKKTILLLLVLAMIVPQMVCVAKDRPEIAIIVKLEHPWFDDMVKGIEEAARELNVNAYMLAPAEADAAQQVALVESCIAKGVDAISVVPNDPAAIEPVLKKAQNADVYKRQFCSLMSLPSTLIFCPERSWKRLLLPIEAP